MSPLVTVKLLVVNFEHFDGCAKVVVMLTNSGGCNLKSQQILRTSRGNPQVERAMKLPCQDPCWNLCLSKTILADISTGSDYESEPSRDSCQSDSCGDCDRDLCSYWESTSCWDFCGDQLFPIFLPRPILAKIPARSDDKKIGITQVEILTGCHRGTVPTLVEIVVNWIKKLTEVHGGTTNYSNLWRLEVLNTEHWDVW